MIDPRDLYQGLQDALPPDPSLNQMDYDALDQGPEGTQARHQAVMEALSPHIPRAHLTDIGCGSGLFIDTLKRHRATPEFYAGVDFMPCHREIVEHRLDVSGIPGSFDVLDTGPGLDGLDLNNLDVCVVIGLVGPRPFNTVQGLVRLVSTLSKHASKFAVTVPLQQTDFLGCAYQAHFDLEDLTWLMGALGPRPKPSIVRVTHKEALIHNG